MSREPETKGEAEEKGRNDAGKANASNQGVISTVLHGPDHHNPPKDPDLKEVYNGAYREARK